MQRLPGVVGYSNDVKLALTARRFPGLGSNELGLFSPAFDFKHELDEAVRDVAEAITDWEHCPSPPRRH
ncbi:hypothetical protein K1719_042974 [Acacia pycnantha]|nr:hypothetical protein K1719_042974 [Acacia pycnantha]